GVTAREPGRGRAARPASPTPRRGWHRPCRGHGASSARLDPLSPLPFLPAAGFRRGPPHDTPQPGQPLRNGLLGAVITRTVVLPVVEPLRDVPLGDHAARIVVGVAVP